MGLRLAPDILPHTYAQFPVDLLLQRDILESEGRAVEEFEEVEVALAVEFNDGGAFRVAEGGIGALDDIFEIFTGNFGLGDVERHDTEGQFLEAQVAPFRLPTGGEGRDFLGDEETTIGSETLENDLLEGKLLLEIAS